MANKIIDVKVEIDDKKLREGIERLKKGIGIKVGLLGADGSKKAKDKDGKPGKLTEATLGAIQEFGTLDERIPARSFLGMPLRERFVGELKSNPKFRAAVQKLDVVRANDHMGITALGVIDDAFDSGGWGKWAPLADVTKRRKKSDKILIDTGDLRRSINYEHIKGKVDK